MHKVMGRKEQGRGEDGPQVGSSYLVLFSHKGRAALMEFSLGVFNVMKSLKCYGLILCPGNTGCQNFFVYFEAEKNFIRI